MTLLLVEQPKIPHVEHLGALAPELRPLLDAYYNQTQCTVEEFIAAMQYLRHHPDDLQMLVLRTAQRNGISVMSGGFTVAERDRIFREAVARGLIDP
jgi:hypothetical protein